MFRSVYRLLPTVVFCVLLITACGSSGAASRQTSGSPTRVFFIIAETEGAVTDAEFFSVVLPQAEELLSQAALKPEIVGYERAKASGPWVRSMAGDGYRLQWCTNRLKYYKPGVGTVGYCIFPSILYENDTWVGGATVKICGYKTPNGNLAYSQATADKALLSGLALAHELSHQWGGFHKPEKYHGKNIMDTSAGGYRHVPGALEYVNESIQEINHCLGRVNLKVSKKQCRKYKRKGKRRKWRRCKRIQQNGR